MSSGLDCGPEILHPWPLSPDAKLSLGRGANNPAKPAIRRLKIPSFDRYAYRIFDAGQFLMPLDSDISKVSGNRVHQPQF